MKKAVLVLTIVIFIIIALSWRLASANPNLCPPGQEKANGCVWAQHQVTRKCMWLPAQSVNPPWVTIREGTCPAAPRITPYPPPVETTVPPIVVTVITVVPITTTPQSGSNPNTNADPGNSSSAPGCDICSLLQTIAAAQATQAAAAATMAAKP